MIGSVLSCTDAASVFAILRKYNLNLKDGGIHKSSFALNRSTNPVSVLVEVAYMINPEEYILLQQPEFQKKQLNQLKTV